MTMRLPAVSKMYTGDPGFLLDCSHVTLSGEGYTCIIGRNGSGKSTYGEGLAELHSTGREKWYYLPQYLDRFLFAENLVEQLETLLTQKLDIQKLVDLVKEMGFPDADRMLEFPFLLMSGGERRRMALICVFYMDPGQVILDEPEIGVTPKENMVLLSKLHNLTAHHASILIISHNDEFVRQSSNLICLRKGIIERVGRTQELLSDPSFELKNYGVRFTQE